MSTRTRPPPGRDRRFPGERFPIPTPRPLTLPLPRQTPLAPLIETFDGEWPINLE